MGIDYNGGIIVGVEGRELACELDEDIWGLIDKYDLDHASPQYDDDLEDCIIGKWVTSELKVSDLERFVVECQVAKEILDKIPAFDSATIMIYGTQDIT